MPPQFDPSGWPSYQVEAIHTRFVQRGVIAKQRPFGLFVSSMLFQSVLLANLGSNVNVATHSALMSSQSFGLLDVQFNVLTIFG